MGNSGWCMSKEVEYHTGEAYRSRNSEFLFKKSEEKDCENQEKSEENMEKSNGNLKNLKNSSAKMPDADNEAKQVSNRFKNRINEPFYLLFSDKEFRRVKRVLLTT